MTIALSILFLIASLFLILVVLLQSGKSQGLGEIGGAAETFFGKNMARSMDAKLEKITKISCGAFLVLTFVLAVL